MNKTVIPTSPRLFNITSHVIMSFLHVNLI
jgi:hypothetical protein